MPAKTPLGKQVYQDASSFGRIYTLMGAIGATLLGSLFIVGGVYVFRQKDKDTGETQGKITQVNKVSSDKVHQYRVAYTVNKKPYTATVHSSTLYAVNDTVTVYYNPSKPTEAELKRQPYQILGAFTIAIAVLVILGAWLQYYLARRSRLYAAAAGVGGAVGVVRNAMIQ